MIKCADTEYDRFCDLLHAYAYWKGIGATEQDLKDTEFPYVDTLKAVNSGRITLQTAMSMFVVIVHRHMRQGRRIAEAG